MEFVDKAVIEEQRIDFTESVFELLAEGQAKVVPKEYAVVRGRPDRRQQDFLLSNSKEETGFLAYINVVTSGQESLPAMQVWVGIALHQTALKVHGAYLNQNASEEREDRDDHDIGRDSEGCCEEYQQDVKRNGQHGNGQTQVCSL